MTRSSEAVAVAIAVLSAGLSGRLPAQTRPAGARGAIDTVVVVNHNVFPTPADGPRLLARLANALHVTTRSAVIRRVLLVTPGDPYDSARVVESERALRGLSVFSQVRVDTARVGNRLALRVETTDGWSTKPQLGYSTAGGDVTWLVGINEDNLLGTATSLSAVYSRNPDRRSFELGYLNSHFIGRRDRLFLAYRNLSDGRGGAWQVGVPFYETAARYALGTDGEAAEERVLIFRDGVLDTAIARHALRFRLTGGYALRATTRDFLRLWYGGHWRREDFAPESTTVFPRSTFFTAGAGLELGHVRFQVLERFNSYARREDVDLSQILRVGVWAAPRAWGYASDRAGAGPEASLQLSATWPRGFAVLRGQADGVFARAGLDTARALGSLTVASQNLPRQTVILHLEGGALRRTKPGSEFDLGLGKRGPRVFGAHAFSGDRMGWLALEDRILVADELWGLVGLGVAPFFDWGGAWFVDERARLGGDAGIALRLGPTRAVRGDVAEIAIGYRFGQGFTGSRWAIAVRRGVVF